MKRTEEIKKIYRDTRQNNWNSGNTSVFSLNELLAIQIRATFSLQNNPTATITSQLLN